MSGVEKGVWGHKGKASVGEMKTVATGHICVLWAACALARGRAPRPGLAALSWEVMPSVPPFPSLTIIHSFMHQRLGLSCYPVWDTA